MSSKAIDIEHRVIPVQYRYSKATTHVEWLLHCIFCNGEFWGRRIDKKYCSYSCRDRYKFALKGRK